MQNNWPHSQFQWTKLDVVLPDKIMHRIKYQSLSVIVYVVVSVDKKSPAL